VEHRALSKYNKIIHAFKPNLHAYDKDKHVERDELDYAGVDSKPAVDAVERMAQDVIKQIGKRKAVKLPTVEEDIDYINDGNRRFNERIAKAYDRYTKDIQDSFERGTAL
jgi:pre-mRNA-splicing factor SYF2